MAWGIYAAFDGTSDRIKVWTTENHSIESIRGDAKTGFTVETDKGSFPIDSETSFTVWETVKVEFPTGDDVEVEEYSLQTNQDDSKLSFLEGTEVEVSRSVGFKGLLEVVEIKEGETVFFELHFESGPVSRIEKGSSHKLSRRTGMNGPKERIDKVELSSTE